MKWPRVVYKDENPWITYAHNLVRKKNNSLNIVVVGPTGVGKSWATISYLKMVDPTFNIDRIHFKASQFVKALQGDTLKPTQAIMLDEAGISLSSQRWWDKFNQALTAILQTARFRRLIIALTVPHFTFISKSVRSLMTAKFKVTGWSKKTQLTTVRPLTIDFNSDTGKIYAKRLIVTEKRGNRFCNFFKQPKPPKDIILEYEKRKKAFTDALYTRYAGSLEEHERKQEIVKKKINLTEHQREILDFLNSGMLIDDIAAKKKIDRRNVYRSIEAAKKKGVIITTETTDKNKITKYFADYGQYSDSRVQKNENMATDDIQPTEEAL